MTRRPTLAEPITIAQWWKTRGGAALTIQLLTYRDKNIVDIRTWRTEEGRLKPTKQGVAAELKHLPKLVSTLAKACSRARELGLIENDAEGDQ
jgi:hypothetical protein